MTDEERAREIADKYAVYGSKKGSAASELLEWATAIREHEREECAKAAEDLGSVMPATTMVLAVHRVATAIRARGGKA